MRIFQLFIFVLSMTCTACAEPTYVKDSGVGSGVTGAEKLSVTCQARFNSGHCVQLNWASEIQPSVKNQFIFKIFRFNRADATPVLEDVGEAIDVQLWMPSMGHGSSPVEVEQLDTGTYSASQVFFIMPGDWEIRFKVKSRGAVVDEAIIPLNL